MKPTIRATIAADIEARIAADPSYRLPRLVDLAQHYGVSYPTAWKAVRLLVNKGTVAGKVGRRLSVGAGTGDAVPAADDASSWQVLFNRIRERLLDGTYLLGRPFPKAGYFVESEAVSYLTVSRAFARLAAENLAHKDGRRWIAGPRSRAGGRRLGFRTTAAAPSVVVVTPDMQSWITIFDDGYNSRFMLPFSAEMGNRGMRLVPAMLWKPADQAANIAGGIDQIRAAVESLGDRYRGMLVLPTAPADQGLGEKLRSMVSLGRPVVYFDSSNAGGFPVREDVSARAGGRYLRFFFDESAAVALALDRLASEGHRTAAYHVWREVDWSLRRASLIRDYGSTLSPAFSAVEAATPEKYWGLWDAPRMSMNSFVRTVAVGTGASAAGGVRGSNRRLLLRNASSLVSALRQDGVTALIALNDHCASQYWLWFRALRIRIPRDISMISFDNLPQSVLFPVSTIDYGFERLGYLAAHVFIGDIDVPSDSGGNVPGVCTLVDRGSIGKPGARGRLGKLLE